MKDFEQKIFAAVKEAVRAVYDLTPEDAVLGVEVPRDPKLGDYATGAAMKLARTLHKSPMDIAQPLAEKLQAALPSCCRRWSRSLWPSQALSISASAAAR